jgi:hypothetical protein
MMDGMGGMMMWGMGLVWLLATFLLVLGIAALVKYEQARPDQIPELDRRKEHEGPVVIPLPFHFMLDLVAGISLKTHDQQGHNFQG